MLKYLRDYLTYSIGVWLSAILSFLATPIISHFISPEEYGKALMFMTVYNIILLIAQLGLNESFIRLFFEVEESKRSALLTVCLLPSLCMFLFLSFIIIALKRLVSQLIVGTYDPSLSYMLIASTFFGILSMYSQRILRVQKRGVSFSIIYLTQHFFNSAIAIFLLIIYRRDYSTIIISNVFSNLLAMLIGFALTYQNWFPMAFDKKLFRAALRYGIPMLPFGLLAWIFTWIDRVSLRMFSDFNEIGLYSTAFRLSSLISLFGTGFFQFWQPIMFEKLKSSNKSFFQKSMEYVSFFVAVLGILVTMFSDIIFLLFSKSYREAARVAPFLLLGPSTQILNYITNVGIEYSKKTIWYSITLLIASIFNFSLNIYLIKILGARGAAISTGLSYLLLFFLRSKVSLKLFNAGLNFRKVAFSLMILCVQATVVTFSGNLSISFTMGALSLFLIFLVNRLTLRSVVQDLKFELYRRKK